MSCFLFLVGEAWGLATDGSYRQGELCHRSGPASFRRVVLLKGEVLGGGSIQGMGTALVFLLFGAIGRRGSCWDGGRREGLLVRLR